MEAIEIKKQRNSNFELLRIIAMYMIVLHHCTAHGVFSYVSDNIGMVEHINNFLCVFLSSGGKIGVTIFVLISGYFLSVKEFKIERLLKIYLKMFAYSVLFLLIALVIGNHYVGGGAFKASFLPFTYGAYWFITAYLLLYMFSPLLNKILKYTSPAQVRLYLLICSFLWVIIPTVTHGDFFYSLLLYFFYLYILGAAIRLGYIKVKQKYLLIAAVIVTIYLIVNILLHLKGQIVNLWSSFKYMELNTIYTLIMSLCIFNFFSKLNLKYNKFINSVAASTFAVYLIHENTFVREYLWHRMLHIHTLMCDKLFGLEVILISLAVFTCCVIFDKLFSKLLSPLIDKLIKKAPLMRSKY